MRDSMQRKRKQWTVHGRLLARHKSQCRELVSKLGEMGFVTLEVSYDNIYGYEPIVSLVEATTTNGRRASRKMLKAADDLLWRYHLAIDARLMGHLSGTRADGAGLVGTLTIDTSSPPSFWAHVDAVECVQPFRDDEALPVC